MDYAMYTMSIKWLYKFNLNLNNLFCIYEDYNLMFGIKKVALFIWLFKPFRIPLFDEFKLNLIKKKMSHSSIYNNICT